MTFGKDNLNGKTISQFKELKYANKCIDHYTTNVYHILPESMNNSVKLQI